MDDNRVSRPDGDAELIVDYGKFNTPHCLKCGGVVKPGIILTVAAVNELDLIGL